MKYGLIGEKLPHSYSAVIHRALGNADYVLHEIAPAALDAFLRARAFNGLNVTIPYKQKVIPYCDVLSDRAARIGAVNTIVQRDGRLYGDNTDYDGLCWLIRGAGISLAGRTVAILGTGGTSKTARTVAEDLGAREILFVSRSGALNYETIYAREDIEILINTTPAGMYPDCFTRIVDLARFPRLRGVVDVVYNPLTTMLVLDAGKRGIPAANGLAMLVAQAAFAHRQFTGAEVDGAIIDRITASLAREKRNIVLIGMPGCGKSTVGKAAARLSGRRFLDTDEMIVQEHGKPIPEIFAQEGEDAFREYEAAAVRRAAMENGVIIAIGGGAMMREDNRDALHLNGYVCFLERALERLATDGRPLSRSPEALRAMYEQRYPVYAANADLRLTVEENVDHVARALLRAFAEA